MASFVGIVSDGVVDCAVFIGTCMSSSPKAQVLEHANRACN